MSFQWDKYFFKIFLPSPLLPCLTTLSLHEASLPISPKHQGHSQLRLLHCSVFFLFFFSLCLKCSPIVFPILAWLAPWSLPSVCSKFTISGWPILTIPGSTNPLTRPHCVTWSLQGVSNLLIYHASCLLSVSP